MDDPTLFKLTITKITLVCREHTPDIIVLDTLLTSTFPEEPVLQLQFKAPKGKGAEYIAQTFPNLPCEMLVFPSSPRTPFTGRD